MAVKYTYWKHVFMSSIVFLGVLETIFGAIASCYICQLSKYDPLSPTNVSEPAMMTVGINVAVIVICFLGWQELKYESKIHIIILNCAFLIVNIMSVGVVVWAFITSENLELQFDKLDFVKDNIYNFNQTFDYIEAELHCYGVYEVTDFYKDGLPESCRAVLESTVFKRGCAIEVFHYTQSVLENVFQLSICEAVLRAIMFLVSLFHVKILKNYGMIAVSNAKNALNSVEKSSPEITVQD